MGVPKEQSGAAQAADLPAQGAAAGAADAPAGAPPEPLPRGRHNLSREDVLGSQRRRLIRAMLDQVAEKGYPATTVGDVVSAARCSRNAFYELFEDKEACYIAASDQTGADLLAALASAAAAEDSWRGALRSGTRSYLKWWVDNPGYAAAYLVHLPSAGQRALEQRDRVYADFAGLFEALAARARAEQPLLPPLPPLAPSLLVMAITELIAQEVRMGRLDSLLELEDVLVRFIVKALT
jgi:AcrR family transcriptional regulator